MLVDPLTKVVIHQDQEQDHDDAHVDHDDAQDDVDHDDAQVQGLGLHSTLYIMWPGLVAASGALFLVARWGMETV